MQRKSSSADVAARAGVSRTTVSYVLSGREDASISVVTRERVLQAARELSYRSNRLANGVLRGQTRMIGVVVPDLLHCPQLSRARSRMPKRWCARRWGPGEQQAAPR